jgi:hypothetical protein
MNRENNQLTESDEEFIRRISREIDNTINMTDNLISSIMPPAPSRHSLSSTHSFRSLPNLELLRENELPTESINNPIDLTVDAEIVYEDELSDEEQDDGTICSICLESVDDHPQNVVMLECSHIFHLKCVLQNSISSSNQYIDTCPNCRHEIPETRTVKRLVQEKELLASELAANLDVSRRLIEVRHQYRRGLNRYRRLYHEELERVLQLRDILARLQLTASAGQLL